MKRTLRGIIALTTVMLTSIMLATGAQAATPDQNYVAGYINTMRNDAKLDSLSFNEQVAASAQAWADHLASVDSGAGSPNPTPAIPPGFSSGYGLYATFQNNYPDGAMAGWKTNAAALQHIDSKDYNTVGTGQAVGKSGRVYIVADLEQINPPTVLTPLPAPAPAPVIAAPAPIAIPQPEPVQAAPVEQAPVQEDPAPEVPAPAAEAPKPTEAPKESAPPVATPTATPSETASAGASATASEPGKSVDTMRTSDNTANGFALSIGTLQAALFGGGGPVTAVGAVLMYRNRKEKPVTE